MGFGEAEVCIGASNHVEDLGLAAQPFLNLSDALVDVIASLASFNLFLVVFPFVVLQVVDEGADGDQGLMACCGFHCVLPFSGAGLSEFLRAAFAAVFLNTCRAHRRVLRLAIADAGWRPSAKKSASAILAIVGAGSPASWVKVIKLNWE